MKKAGQQDVLMGSWMMFMTSVSPVEAREDTCDFQGLVTVKRFSTVTQLDPLPKHAILKVQLIETVLHDVTLPVITGGEVDVSGKNFPLEFNMKLECGKLNHTIMPSFNISVEVDDRLLFNNESMHPFSYDKTLQKIEVKKIH